MNDVFTTDLITSLEHLATTTLAVQPLATLIYGLIGNQFTPSQETVLSDIVPPDWTGYEPVTITSWVAPYKNLQNETVISPTTVPAFNCSANGGTMQTAYGYAGWREDTTVLQLLGLFDTAITPTPGQRFSSNPEVGVNGAAATNQF